MRHVVQASVWLVRFAYEAMVFCCAVKISRVFYIVTGRMGVFLPQELLTPDPNSQFHQGLNPEYISN